MIEDDVSVWYRGRITVYRTMEGRLKDQSSESGQV